MELNMTRDEKFENDPLNGTSITKSTCSRPCIKTWFGDNLLLVLTIAGIIAGFIVGVSVRETRPSATTVMWIGMPGDVFMRMLKMLILPLIVCSVISGLSTLDPRSNGKITIVALVYVIIMNFVGSFLGVIFSFMIPSVATTTTTKKLDHPMLETEDIFADFIRNIFPDNLISASFQQVQTKYTLTTINGTNGTMTEAMVKSLGTVQSSNLLGIMICCILIAIAVNKSGEPAKPFLAFFASASEIFLILLRWIIWSMPIGVMSLIAATLSSIEDLGGTFQSVGYFTAAVISGVVCHQIVIAPLILFLFTRENPFTIILSMARPWLIGFATTSTAVAIPEMFEAVERRNHTDKRISRFCIPLSVAIGANGSAIFISAAAIFIAKISDIDLAPSDYVIILVLTGISSLSIPSVPSASIVTLIIILSSANIPQRNTGLLFAVEWLLDRIRSTSNVISHSSCAIITDRICRKDLHRMDVIDPSNHH